jgi:glucosylceramidase
MQKITTTIFLMVSLFAFSQQKNTVQSKSFSTKNKKITVYTTADSTKLRLTQTDVLTFVPSKQPLEIEVSVFVEPTKTFQTFLGIGGAITDASAEVFAKLAKDKQKEFMNAYYDKEKGIGYSLLRTTIHSSDFASGSYTYINEGDKDLKTFNIDHDRQYRIPMIKEAIKTAGGKLVNYASPWSPPAFMKSTKHML